MKKSERRMRSTRLLLVTVSSLLLLAASGIVDGYLTHRWSGSESLELAAAALDNLPKTIGEWGSEELEITQQVLTVAGATGYAKRMYQNRETGEWIVVTLLCGEHGPISLHPPTVCFTGAGWRAEGKEQIVKYSPTKDAKATTWQAGFLKREDFEEQNIVADWSWNNGTGWRASNNPRYEFAGSPFLIKLYVISDADLTQENAKDRRDQFVKSLLAEIDRTVFDTLSSIDNQDGKSEL